MAVLLCMGTVSPLRASDVADDAPTYATYADAAAATLSRVWFEAGRWRTCTARNCSSRNQDWGADALTYALALRWKAAGGASLVPMFAALVATAPSYGTPCVAAPCEQWSDVPEWDALAALQEYVPSGRSPEALRKARAAYDVIARSPVYALGACPSIRYQLPFGGTNKLKTLETDSNAIRAALLLFADTGERRFLDDAIGRYAAVRRYYLDPDLPLYSVYVFDDGRHCRQLPHRFFASVNGNMIEAGLALAAATHDATYRAQAIATGAAVERHLSDDRGVYANLQAENDVVEPLVEAMYDLATQGDEEFARTWLLRNAAAAAGERSADGSYGRFFDGPPPTGTITAWQTNGGFALMFAAAALAPEAPVAVASWRTARVVATELDQLPATIRFTGSSIALLGTIGEQCCEAGHARVFIDGVETFDRRGIWQNKSCFDGAVPDAVLFAWQWPQSGTHVVRIDSANPNAKEGGSFVHIRGYLVR